MPDFQIFISFKHLAEDGRPTRDSELARDLYDFLESQGLSVFLSNVSLQRLGVAAYKRAIDDALDSAQVLVAVGTSAENLDSQWVRYEWDSFFNDILSGVKPSGRVFVYVEQTNVSDLPRPLRQTQVIQHAPGSREALFSYVNNAADANMPDADHSLADSDAPHGQSKPITGEPSKRDLLRQYTVVPGRTIKAGFSEVMTVIDNQTSEPRAMKRTPKERAPQPRTEFVHVTVDKASVATPEVEWDDDEYYYEILPLIQGWTLGEIMALNRGIYGEILTSWCRLLLQIVDNLQNHSPALIHRDIKPDNIILREASDLSSIVLIDCSAMVMSPVTARIPAFGTPGYSAPEAMEGFPTLASDLYSVGCTLFALNQGQRPPRPSEIQHFGKDLALEHAEHEVKGIFPKLVAPQPSERFPNAEAALRDMRPADRTLRYTLFDDLLLPDGHKIKHGGWY